MDSNFATHGPKLAYFLIWGNGLSQQNEIVAAIAKRYRVLVVKEIELDDPEQFVKTIYRSDGRPHIRDTITEVKKYVLDSEPKVVVVFVINPQPNETLCNDGWFKCLTFLQFKKELRAKFNDGNLEDKRHYIHSSDHEFQAIDLLNYLLPDVLCNAEEET